MGCLYSPAHCLQKSSRSDLEREKCHAPVGHTLLAVRGCLRLYKHPHLLEGWSGKGIPSAAGWCLPSCFYRLCISRGGCQQAPTAAKTGFQAVILCSEHQQATGHSSRYVHLLIFVLMTHDLSCS